MPEIGAEWKGAQETKLAPHFSVPSQLFPYSNSFPHTLTHNFCTDEQTKENSHQPEPALWEESDTQVKTGYCPVRPQDLP